MTVTPSPKPLSTSPARDYLASAAAGQGLNAACNLQPVASSGQSDNGYHSGESGPARSAVNSSLGIDRKVCCHTGKDAAFSSPAEFRWWLLKQAKRLLPENARLQRCMESPIPLTPVVEVVRDPNVNSSHVRYVEHCHNKWACPVCSAWLTNQQRSELDELLAKAKVASLFPVLLTLTLQHHKGDDLQQLIAGLTGALRRILQQRSWRELKTEYGLQGAIRALEVLYGDQNGWHPHFHILLFLDVELSDQQLAGLRSWIFDLWLAALQKEGYNASEAHGVDVATADSKIAEYVAKWGHEPKEREWGAAHEMAKGAAKLSDGELLTPFQLLEAYGDGSRRAGALFREYVAAMKGRTQLGGLKDLQQLLAAVELPNCDPNYTPELPYAVVSATPDGWKQICKYDLVPLVCALVAVAALDELRRLFVEYGIAAVVHDPPDVVQPGELQRDVGAPGEPAHDACAILRPESDPSLGELRQHELPGLQPVRSVYS